MPGCSQATSAYVADSVAGLRVVDVSDPAAPQQVGFYDTPGPATDLDASGDYVYVTRGHLRVVDVSDPANPVETGFCDVPGNARRVAVTGSYAYVAGSIGLEIVNVANPANPVVAGSYAIPEGIQAVAVSGTRAYVSDWYGLHVVSVFNLANMREIGSYDVPGYGYDVASAQGYAYLAAAGSGLWVASLASPATPAFVGFYDTPGYAEGVEVMSGYAYVADGGQGLRVVDVSDPADPSRLLPDFNGDRYDDLVIGVPYEAIGAEAHAGMVHALYGGPGTGLTATGSQLWYQDVADVIEDSEAGDEFGFALAVADLNGDGYRDLAVGVHGEQIGSAAAAGAVHVFYGTATGLSAETDELWNQGLVGLGETAEADDRFGWSLGAGDFNGDGYGDLAVGVLWEDTKNPAIENAGAVHVLYGSANGLTSAGSQVWYEGINGVQGTSQPWDQFGHTLVAGDFDGNGCDDLVIGEPWGDVGTDDSGLVHVLYGMDSGLTAAFDDLWYQGGDGLDDSSEGGDRFGHALAAGDANDDGYDDLAVGVPHEQILAPLVAAGAVHVLYGSPDRLTAAGDSWWHQDVPGIAGSPEEGDLFGAALAAVPTIGYRIYLPVVQAHR